MLTCTSARTANLCKQNEHLFIDENALLRWISVADRIDFFELDRML